MVIAVTSAKGGAGKTTTAMHLAAALQQNAPTLLLDGDPTRNAVNWSEQAEMGKGVSFTVAPETAGPRLASTGRFLHTVMDLGQRPAENMLRELAQHTDLLVIPATPNPIDTDGLVQTIQTLRKIGAEGKYRVLLTRVPPPPQRDGFMLRLQLEEMGVPLFRAEIPALKVFASVVAEGITVNQSKDRNAVRGWDAYAAVAKELLR